MKKFSDALSKMVMVAVSLLVIFGLVTPTTKAADVSCKVACNIMSNKAKIFKATMRKGQWEIPYIKGFADGITEKMNTLVGPLPTMLEILSSGKVKNLQITWGTLAVRIAKLIENNPELAWKIFVISSGNFNHQTGKTPKFPGCIFAGVANYEFVSEPRDTLDVAHFITDVIGLKLTASSTDELSRICGNDNVTYVRLIMAILKNDVSEIDSIYQTLIVNPNVADPVKFAQFEISTRRCSCK